MRGRFVDLVLLALASILTGGLVGVVGSGFRFLLGLAERLRESLILQAHVSPIYGAGATVLAVGIACALARWLVVQFAPIAAGSGVQHVEAMMRGEVAPAGLAVIPVKFIGGLLAIGSGLVLGREGPTVQMGAAIGTALSTRVLAKAPDRTVVDAAGAGAGLAVAFNAPIGGAIFVFEEITRSFTPRQVIATVGAAAIAVAVMRQLLGNPQEFAAGDLTAQPIPQLPFFLGLGALLGLAGAAYSALTLGFLSLAERLAMIPSIVRAALIGVVTGAVAWFAPALIGGGETLVQDVLDARFALTSLALICAARFVIGPFCYAAATPGGLFAPLLAVGAAFGALYANLLALWLPDTPWSPVAFAVVGMAALFTAVVRAPLTGMVLTIEMTGRADLALAMLFACLGAGFIATAVGSEPIYDTLRCRMLATARGAARTATQHQGAS
jgi:CIC family chloride channel protein